MILVNGIPQSGGTTYTGTANQIVITGDVLSLSPTISGITSVSMSGRLSCNNILFGVGGYIQSPANGVITLNASGGIVFDRLVIGDNSATTGTSIKYSTTTMKFRLGDDSADCDITAKAGTFSGSIAFSNTVTAAVGIASTHKVTAVINGSTYYLMASNV